MSHMWRWPVSYESVNFQGTVNNEPVEAHTVKLGQKVTVAPSKISDWMVVDNRKLVGGQTVRRQLDEMTPAERAGFLKSAPYTVE